MEKIILKNKGKTSFLILNNEEKKNAFDPGMLREIDESLDQISADPNIRVLIIQATGRSFSAGADLHWMKSMADYSREENLADARQLSDLLHKLRFFPKPIIAEINGPAFGGAVGIAACVDIALGTPNAKFCLSEVRLGLVPSVISPFVIDAVGNRWARRLFQTAEIFDASRALDIGLIHEICLEDELSNRSQALAEQISMNAPDAVGIAKNLLTVNADLKAAERAEALCSIIADRRVSDEAQEGMRCFFNKTKPSWCADKGEA